MTAESGEERGARAGVHWFSVQEAGLSIGLWFLYAVYRIGGRALFHLVLWPVAWYYAATRRVARAASREYLERIGELTAQSSAWMRWRCVTRHIFAFADVMLDKALVWTGALDLSHARIEVDPQVDAVLSSGERGGVFVVAHHGNLEAMRAFSKRLPKLKMTILVHTKHAQRFNNVLTRLNPESAANLVQVTEIDAAVAAGLAACVERGEYVVIAADRVPVSGLARTVTVPFLGAPAPFPSGPWILAAALDCPVYWLGCAQEQQPDGRSAYTLRCELLTERVSLPRARRAEALQAVVSAYAAQLEACCRRAPYAWFNFYPFWATAEEKT